MAIKDWEKKGILEWENKLNGDIIFIDSPATAFIKDYVFVYPSDKKIRRFKTKKQALTIAKAYMRKH